ncbi:AbiJ-NTD4 domain-containing protein [Jiella avicenniae]|uniref:HEPN AbiJ-N-terminal domain-containing protein n=1 Tax=Jiella avicenniae TaxID=2907202 RepID=A0A9X1NY77_9HYPH|nr:hypothetical protein [Jiella avicenniae]MCE7026489.1 hypothetical protein [Jiella avicenniae]
MPDLPEAKIRPFSLRHGQAIEDRAFHTDIPDRLRNRLWLTAQEWNEVIHYNTKDNPAWWSSTSVLDETAREYERLLGLTRYSRDSSRGNRLHAIFVGGSGPEVLDILEIMYALMPDGEPAFQRAINDAFVDFSCPWRLADGMFFRMDSAFLEEEVLARATDLLGSPELAGAHAEFMRARDDLTDGASRDAIVYAAHSVESTLKAVTGKSGTIDKLQQEFISYGMDDLPTPKARAAAKALMSVAILRNELGGHGQGAAVMEVPQPYAELAVHLAAAINFFVVTQHLKRKPPESEKAEPTEHGYTSARELDDEIPF